MSVTIAGAPRDHPTLASAAAEFATLLRRRRVSADILRHIAANAAPGQGRAVLVLPSLCRGDRQMRDLRRLLGTIGYVPYGWEQGLDLGPTPRAMRRLRPRAAMLAERHGTLSLVGFSMGGLFARWLALEMPNHVARVVTVGSPWRDAARSAAVPPAALQAIWPGTNLAILSARLAAPLPMPAVSLYSRRDGIVAWRSCFDPGRPEASIEVACRHVLMPSDPQVLAQIAQALAG